MKKNIKINKPESYQIIFGAFLTILFDRFKKNKNDCFLEIGEYKLIKPIKKNYPSDFSVGIYQMRDKKYFVKTWRGYFKNLSYYSIINEYFVNKIIENQSISLGGNKKLNFPKVVSFVKEEKTFSIIFKYIEGTNLETLSAEIKSELLSNIAKKLHGLSKKLTKNELIIFPKRSLSFYILTLPIITVCSLTLLRFHYFGKILEYFKGALVNVFDKNNLNLELSHRDLNPNNVIIKGNKVYLTDNEGMVFTIPNYDQTYLLCSPELLKLDNFNTNINYPSLFLRNYVLLHLILIYAMLFGPKSNYVYRLLNYE